MSKPGLQQKTFLRRGSSSVPDKANIFLYGANTDAILLLQCRHILLEGGQKPAAKTFFSSPTKVLEIIYTSTGGRRPPGGG